MGLGKGDGVMGCGHQQQEEDASDDDRRLPNIPWGDGFGARVMGEGDGFGMMGLGLVGQISWCLILA